MFRIKLSSRRRVTFPKQVCDALGVVSGDEILLEPRVDGSQEAWVLHSSKSQNREWLGCLSAYAEGKSHDMHDIRKSVIRGRKLLDENKFL